MYKITRTKLYPVPGTNYRFAWKWLYAVELDGARIFAGYDRLDSTLSAIRRFARSRGEAKPVIVKSWQSPQYDPEIVNGRDCDGVDFTRRA